MKAIDILFGSDRFDNPSGINMGGQRHLDENAVDRWVGVEFTDDRQKGWLGGICGQRVLNRVKPKLLGLHALIAHIDLTSRIATDEYDRETGRRSRGNEGIHGQRNLAAQVRCGERSIDDLGNIGQNSTDRSTVHRGRET
jgi:hypothetical protein